MGLIPQLLSLLTIAPGLKMAPKTPRVANQADRWRVVPHALSLVKTVALQYKIAVPGRKASSSHPQLQDV
jgi:hypothetical protein